MTQFEKDIQKMMRYLQKKYLSGRILTRDEAVKELGLEDSDELDILLNSRELSGLHIRAIARYIVSFE